MPSSSLPGARPRASRVARVPRRVVVAALLLAAPVPARSAFAFVWPTTIETVSGELSSSDPTVRRRAARELSRLPSRAAIRLGTPALDDPDPVVRVAALEALLSAGATGLGARLAGWLGDPELIVRLAAAEALSDVPDAGAVVALGRVLSDPDPRVRAAAARALGNSGAKGAPGTLLGHLDDPEPTVREATIEALARLGDRGAVVPLVSKLQDPRPSVRRVAAAALGALGDARGATVLGLSLRDPEESVRVAALDALGRIRAPEMVATIVALLVDERRPAVREAAFTALGRIATDEALDALVGALGEDDPLGRSPVRAALVSAGTAAVPRLVACVGAPAAPARADGCAIALGTIGGPGAVDAVARALAALAVRPGAALSALAASHDPTALPVVLEQLSAADPWVRGLARDAASALLDPAAADGRAVEPLRLALLAARGRPREVASLVALLGRTGSPAAAPTLSSLAADTTDDTVRLAAIEALGFVGRAGQDAVLLSALSDRDPEIRRAAALALRRSGGAPTARVLLDRLARAAAQDRVAVGLALPGPFSVATDAALVRRAEQLATTLPPGGRDALLDALAVLPGDAAAAALARLAGRLVDPAARAKVAEALSARGAPSPALRVLAAEPDGAVRANAAWALGATGGAGEAPLLVSLLEDRDAAVAGNAAGALARLSRQGKVDATTLCAHLADGRPLVRANLLTGLGATGKRCDGGIERRLLATDRSALVRAAAARLIARTATDPDDATALARCAAEEVRPDVAAACARPPAAEGRGGATVTVYVVPSGASEPAPHAPFTLVRADGLLRAGRADARGAVTEHDAPRGELRLEVAYPYLR